MIRVIVLMTLMPDARVGDVIAALAGDLALVPWARPWRPASARAAGDWRNALGPVPLEELRDLVLGSSWREHQDRGCPGAVTIGKSEAADGGVAGRDAAPGPGHAREQGVLRHRGHGRRLIGPYPCLRALPLTCCSCRALFAMPHGPAGTDKAAAEQCLLDEAMDRFPALFDPGWIWLMDRNYHGAPRIARMIRSTHVLIRLKSDIPLQRTSEILPDGSYRAELSGDGVTVPVRVIEYYADVEGQEVPEMFCLVTDLMDWEDYPAPELAALYRWRWDGSETALREAKAPLRGAGPGTGPMLRSCSPDLVAAGARGLGRRHRDDPRRRSATPRSPPRPPGRDAGPGSRSGPATCPSPAPSGRSCPRSASGTHCYQAVTSEIAGYRNVVDRGPAPRPQVQVPLVLRARDREGHRHPHRPRRHHHGQHPSLTSGNTANPPERGPRRTVDPAAPARHAALRHARRKGTTRSNQKQELPTTGQTPKAHGIAPLPVVRGCRPRVRPLSRQRAFYSRDSLHWPPPEGASP